ncbi:MAG TPA: LuxR C-terminal-related transcriptional regulator [Actinomycetota bacterium]
MRPRVVAVVHRHALVAEGLAAGLAGYPGLVPVRATDDPLELEPMAGRLDAVAMDPDVPRGQVVAAALRREGVRVVFVGRPGDGDEGVWISASDGLGALAAALVPGIRGRDGQPLTRREREVLELVARGLVGKQVARHLGISPKTVERHKTHIFAKLGVPNQAAAVSVAFASNGGNRPWSPSIT